MTIVHNQPSATFQIILAKAVARERVRRSIQRYWRAKREHIDHPEAYKQAIEDGKRFNLPIQKLDPKQSFLRAHKVKINRKSKITLPKLEFMQGD